MHAYKKLGTLLHETRDLGKAVKLYKFVMKLLSKPGIETVYLHHIDLSKIGFSDNNNFTHRETTRIDDTKFKYLKTQIPLDSRLSADLLSLPNITPVESKTIKSQKLASGIRSGGIQFSANYDVLDEPQQSIRNFKQQFIDTVSTLLNYSIFIEESFYVIYSGQSYTRPHWHLKPIDHKLNLSKVKYSAVYYINTGDVSATEPGDLKLHDPDVLIKPQSGDLVIFSADRYHSVLYNGNKSRLILGVNFYRI